MNFKFKNKFLFISLLNFLSIFYLIGNQIIENKIIKDIFKNTFFYESFKGSEKKIEDSFNAFEVIDNILLSNYGKELSNKQRKKIKNELIKIFENTEISSEEESVKKSYPNIYRDFELKEIFLRKLKELKSGEKIGFIRGLKESYFCNEIKKKRGDIFKRVFMDVSEFPEKNDGTRLKGALDFYKKNNDSWELSKEEYKNLLFILREALELKLDSIPSLSEEEKENLRMKYEEEVIRKIDKSLSKSEIEKIFDYNSKVISEIIENLIGEREAKEREDQKLKKQEQVSDTIKYEAEKEKLKKFPLMGKFKLILDLYGLIYKNKNFDKKKFEEIRSLIDKLKNNKENINDKDIELLEKKVIAGMQSIYDKENNNKGNKNNGNLLKDLERIQENNPIAYNFLEELKKYEDKNKNKKEMKLLKKEEEREENLKAIEEYKKEYKKRQKELKKLEDDEFNSEEDDEFNPEEDDEFNPEESECITKQDLEKGYSVPIGKNN